MMPPWQSILFSLLTASRLVTGQIAKPEFQQPLTIPEFPEVSDGQVEDTYPGRVNITWPDGAGYSVRCNILVFE